MIKWVCFVTQDPCFTIAQKLNLMEVADPSGRTAIFCVSTAGCLETVKMLLEGFSAEEKWRLISMQDDSGQTPLFNVAAEEYGDTMKTLLSDLTAEQH